MSEAVQILNARLHNVTRAELLANLRSGMVIPANVDVIMKLQRDAAFRRTWERAEVRVCDSQIVMFAAALLGTPLREKISGSDFFGEFCAYHANNPEVRIFLLGGREGVAQAARRNINRRVGREIITHAHSPSFGFERNEAECRKIVDAVNASHCTVLAVGVGCPKQEMWIDRYREHMPNVRIFLCIGATIDFEAGSVRRAPRWMQRLGLEWLFRMLQEPRRLARRYLLDDLPFVWLLLQQRLGRYRAPS